ncbi:heme NO-binding domain-containing protein [Tabrizicola sp.]|uniref:heme NO-binding domain-containing protein n=1 Tax=Tabrizicola sp. TaxID=2005166 RepID=UPI0027371A22|nr:heme NO-binding domain-containing protein [Tabrizicola sp.]MDP3195001.1 heme NO-binding domain-containing protein [Tabrizicola sp.]
MRDNLAAETVLGSDMDALLLRSLQGYVIDTFGAARWQMVCRRAELSILSFEPMLRYDPGSADRIGRIAAEVLGRPVEAIWEDVGTHLVTNPDREGIRRLLRFGGVTFADFLYSLEDLPGRARLAMPDLELPDVTVDEVGEDRFELRCQSHLGATQRVLVGLLTAMADDYGALCLIEAESADCTSILVLDRRHAKARRFDLAPPER